MSADEKKATIKKTNGIFLLNVKSSAGKEATWTIDLKKDGEVVKGAKGKPGELIVSIERGEGPSWGADFCCVTIRRDDQP